MQSPIEAYELAHAGGEAETVRRVLGELLTKELDRCLSFLSECEPDFGQYAKIAGEIRQIYRLRKSLELNILEGRDAVRLLRRG